MFAGDLNFDGRPDIVVTSEADNSVAVFINLGPFFRFEEISSTAINAAGLSLVDLNRDGHLDIIVAQSNGVFYYENDGSAESFSVSPLLSGSNADAVVSRFSMSTGIFTVAASFAETVAVSQIQCECT